MPAFMVRLAKKSGPLDEDGGDDDLAWHAAVAKALPALDRLAARLALPPLSQFVSEDPENVFDAVDDEDEAKELLATLPPVRWFPPADALPTVRGLLARLASGRPVEGVRNPAKVIPELRNLEVVLEYGAGKRARFRFYREC